MTSAASPTRPAEASAAQRERRRRILDATVALASEGGFDAVQMRTVAERADVALGTLYRYFPSKVHLLVTALDRELDTVNQRLRRSAVAGDAAEERVRHLLGRMSRSLQRDARLTEALIRAYMFADASVAAESRAVEGQVATMLLRALRPAGAESDPGSSGSPAEAHDRDVAKVIGDVWLASLVQWVTGRATAADVTRSLDVAVRLILR